MLSHLLCVGGKPVPAELKGDLSLVESMQFDDAETERALAARDDEYERAGFRDPKIMITTSRDPSSRLTQFAKEMKLVFPNSQRVNRGNHVMKEVVDACKANEVTDLIILHEHRGVPGTLMVSFAIPECYVPG